MAAGVGGDAPAVGGLVSVPAHAAVAGVRGGGRGEGGVTTKDGVRVVVPTGWWGGGGRRAHGGRSQARRGRGWRCATAADAAAPRPGAVTAGTVAVARNGPGGRHLVRPVPARGAGGGRQPGCRGGWGNGRPDWAHLSPPGALVGATPRPPTRAPCCSQTRPDHTLPTGGRVWPGRPDGWRLPPSNARRGRGRRRIA